jgi:hypothetical protein
MASDSKNDVLKTVRHRRYLNKEFDSFRADLLEYARTYYKDRIQDFSDNSLGGVFLDFAAYVGDVMSFYLDHQFTELDPETAVETQNIQNHLRREGVDIVGASPAVVELLVGVEVPAQLVNNVSVPRPDCIPVIDEGSIAISENGTEFILIEQIDMTARKTDGNLVCNVAIGDSDDGGIPTSFILSQKAMALSGFRIQETFTVGGFIPFREITLSNPNVTEIESVFDSNGNVYYEVRALSQDVVYRGIPNINDDNELVREVLEVVPAPYRFMKKVSLDTRSTTLVMGGGSADTIEDDVIPDPTTFALPLYGKKTFTRLAINPQQLIDTRTLGVVATDVTLYVNYRYGGGLSHNAEPTTINTMKTLLMAFPGNPPAALASFVRSSTQVTNKKRAAGGDDAPTFDELKSQIPQVKNSQDRIVTRPDLLARVYTMPAKFGRVWRASVRTNPNNPLATQLFIISRDAEARLVVSPDTLKLNLKRYLNDYRMISDAIDVLDAQVIDLRLNFEIVTDPTANKKLILQQILTKLKKYFEAKNFQIDQPIVINDINNIIYNNLGVISINSVRFENLTGLNANRTYSDVHLDIKSNTVKNLIIPPPGGIFEVRFPDVDIIGRAI